MLPKNFPGKKDARRRRALEWMKRVRNPDEKLLETIKNTEEKLSDKARSIKNKIARGKPGK